MEEARRSGGLRATTSACSWDRWHRAVPRSLLTFGMHAGFSIPARTPAFEPAKTPGNYERIDSLLMEQAAGAAGLRAFRARCATWLGQGAGDRYKVGEDAHGWHSAKRG